MNRRFVEFVALMATLTSLVALSVDTMLPALGTMGRELGVSRPNDVQLVVTLLLLGMAVGQMLYGPLSDGIGRRPAIFLGMGLFAVGAFVSFRATSFPMMLFGRALQGLGAAGPRVTTVAIIRDEYDGRTMARVMSLVMAVFIIVPILAPSLGQALLFVSGWRTIFAVFLGLAVLVTAWFALRQPETLAAKDRIPLSAERLLGSVRRVLQDRIALGYSIAAGLVFGAFVGYLSSAQQVLQEQYGLGARFPLYFALLSLAIGGASLVNARLVMRFGMQRLSRRALLGMLTAVALFVAPTVAWGGHPPLPAFLAFLLVVFFCEGVLYGNLNALAMEPLGDVAGVGAAVVGTLSTLLSIAAGTLVGQAYDGTVTPLVVGFGILSLLSLLATSWAEARSAAA